MMTNLNELGYYIMYIINHKFNFYFDTIHETQLLK